MSESKTRSSLLKSAKSLCDSFANKSDLPTLLSHFSTNTTPVAFEHGNPSFAPFIGKEFKGEEGIKEYFEYLQKYIGYEDMSFGEYFVDEKELIVSVKGKVRFKWLSTGVEWDEIFTYVLDYVEEEGDFKLAKYQVWADTGALYLARLGKKVEDFVNEATDT